MHSGSFRWRDFGSFERIEEEDEEFEESEIGVREKCSAMATREIHVRERPRLQRAIVRALFTIALVFSFLHFTPIMGIPGGLARRVSGLSCRKNTQLIQYGRLQKRANSPTDVCKRWSQQSALVNGTIYLYGGRAITSSSQTSNTWNNNFLTLDVTKGWKISAPPLSGLAQPSGPPAVANGYLWSSHDSLFLFGGEYSDNPEATPDAYSVWEYNIKSSSWIQHSNPSTSDGKNSEPGGQGIVSAAEGAGFSVSALGMGWYFGGHIDSYTTPGWSKSTPRQYLKSFVEFTFPGATNPGVNSLGNGKTAGSDGAWRNITNAGIQDQAGFTERADGLLLYVPGFGSSGVLLSLAGGTNDTFTQMNEVDVYDIAGSTWYRQATSGPTPEIRVNPCAIVASAPDGSSAQIYMYGGQNLIPAGSQTQYSDMWILSVPSFNWIQVNTSSQSTPYARAGHTCDVWDGQMIVVGGYIGKDISCETPGIYVFNLTSLQWVNSFNALSVGSSKNPYSQQLSQVGSGKKAGLQGSYGYTVPKQVYDVIGGNGKGGATITTPMAQATAGPLATGKPITYTVTGPNGGTITETGVAVPMGGSKTNVGAAVAGSVAGFFFILACYLAFCAMLYRKQLQIYKHHVAMAARADGTPVPELENSGGRFFSGRRSWLRGGKASTEGSRHSGGDGTYWAPGHRPSNSLGENSNPNGEGGIPPYGRPGEGEPMGSAEDLLSDFEPTYWGVLLHPRRSLRVVNR